MKYIKVHKKVASPTGATGPGVELWDGNKRVKGVLVQPTDDERIPDQISLIVWKWWKQFLEKE
jgi:hypothetical protein